MLGKIDQEHQFPYFREHARIQGVTTEYSSYAYYYWNNVFREIPEGFAPLEPGMKKTYLPFKNGDRVSYSCWDRSKKEWYRRFGTITGLHEGNFVIRFEDDGLEYICQERRLRKEDEE